MEPLRLSVNLDFPVEVYERRPENPRSVILLLHGYSETGRRILRKLGPVLPEDALVLSPNGSYPVPVKLPEPPGGYREGYGWYFYNPHTDEYARDMSVAIQALVKLVEKSTPPGLPIDIIGFSQGGYLAPFVAQKIPRVRRVFAIAGRFLHEEIVGVPQFELHGIHGADDPIIPVAEAERSLQELVARGAHGSFLSIANSAHRIDEKMQAAIARKLS